MGRKVFIINCVLAIAFMAGCDWIPGVKYTRQVNLTVPAGQAEFFTAETHNGNITVNGSQTTNCNLAATIIAMADTEENAKKIAEQVKIELVPEGNSINVKIEKPDIPKLAQIIVNLDVNLPQIMNLSLSSHNGNIIITDTSAGAKVSTHNGNINYTGTAADLKLESHNGNIDIHCVGQSTKPCQTIVETHNGNIDFAAPEKFSASVDASTHNGSIHTNLPITVTSKTDKELKGVIGSGRDKLHLKTHNGLIKIK